MHHVYIRCNSGHYFVGEVCPLDGWSSAESRELVIAVRAMGREATTIAQLREHGLSEAALRRTIIVEFGDSNSAVEAISPEGYFVDGQWIKKREFDSRFT